MLIINPLKIKKMENTKQAPKIEYSELKKHHDFLCGKIFFINLRCSKIDSEIKSLKEEYDRLTAESEEGFIEVRLILEQMNQLKANS